MILSWAYVGGFSRGVIFYF